MPAAFASRARSARADTEQPADARSDRKANRRGGERMTERLIAGIPARIMRPRLVFLACLGAILAFGLLMVYSASAVEALSETGSSTYYLVRQAGWILAGLIAMLAVSRASLTSMRSPVVWGLWIAMLVLLLAVLAVGVDAGGARRWINIGMQFQPSEFAKPLLIVTTAKICHEYYEERSLDTLTFLVMLGAAVLLPVALIILEPDLGTCLIIGGTIFCMCYFAGFSYRLIIPLIAVALVVAFLFVITSGYRSARLISDPWADPYGDGYQATLAIMAFASGGLFGRGIGNSTMKYNYLPEAHNDYILAIIGEELGFFGMLVFIGVYFMMVYAAFQIARQAPTIQGRLIAYGSAVLIMLQFLVNALGILGVTPMTGKTMPLISYGGTSMISTLMVCGLILRVSLESNPRTVHDERRGRMAVMGEEPAAPGTIEGSTAGPARRRSERPRGGFTVVDGTMPHRGPVGSGDAVETGRAARDRGPARAGAPLAGSRARSDQTRQPYERIDLNYDAADRLRSQRRDRSGEDWTGGGSGGRPRSGRGRYGR